MRAGASLWERTDRGSAALLAARRRRAAKLQAMEAQPTLPGAPPHPDLLSAEARGLFAAGWYATRDEGRLVHPLEQTEQTVSPDTWRALRELDARVPVNAPLEEAA